MVHGPKEKKERALGEHLHVKGARCNSPKCALIRKPYRPGVHGKSRRRALSEFGKQIREKQKFKVSYGINEGNLRLLFEDAERHPGSTAKRLLTLLEQRLDNVIFRLAFAESRSMARQMVIHGHVFVNQKRVRSPGMRVNVGDVIHVREESKAKGAFRTLHESLKTADIPSWLEVNAETLEGKVLSLPEGSDQQFEVNLLVESFSK